MKDRRLYSVAGLVTEAAKQAGAAKPVSTQTARRFDAVLQPARTESGQRIYDAKAVRIAAAVLHAKK